jgi:predicted ferric reductase
MRYFGLIAWFLFSLSFFYAIPSRLLVLFLGGLARRSRLHHWIGLSTIFLVAIHIFSEIKSDPIGSFDLEDPFLLIGWVGTFLLVFGIVFSFFNNLNHRLWVFFHWSLGFSFLAVFLHGFAFLSESIIDKIVFSVAFILGCLSLFSIVFMRLFQMPWKVIGIQRMSEKLYELDLQPAGIKKYKGFKAGMIVYLQLGKNFSSNWHPFSIASCQSSPIMRLLIKNVGEDTSHLQDLKLGTVIGIIGPFQEFISDPLRDQVWISAGVGIAPFLGMCRCFTNKESQVIRLISYLSSKEQALADEMVSIQSCNPNFKAKIIVTSDANFKEIDRLLNEVENPMFLICGSNSFMKKAHNHLLTIGIESGNIQTEEFQPW